MRCLTCKKDKPLAVFYLYTAKRRHKYRPGDANDLPMIRQALNDTADAMRKIGFTVGDYSQTFMVKEVQRRLRRR